MHPLIAILAPITKGIKATTISTQYGLGLRRVRNGLRLLVRRGLAIQVHQGLYRLTDAGRSLLKPTKKTNLKIIKKRSLPKLTTQRARIWRAMRVLKKFTSTELIVQANRDDETISYSNIIIFLRQLEAADYIVILGARSRPNRWILIKDTGRYPPVFNFKDRKAYDPNTGETHDY